jgi:hypothetical protein
MWLELILSDDLSDHIMKEKYFSGPIGTIYNHCQDMGASSVAACISFALIN